MFSIRCQSLHNHLGHRGSELEKFHLTIKQRWRDQIKTVGDADQDYIQPQEEAEESLEESGTDDDLKALLSNKIIPEKQRAQMKQLIFERQEQFSRSKQKKAATKLQSQRDS